MGVYLYSFLGRHIFVGQDTTTITEIYRLRIGCYESFEMRHVRSTYHDTTCPVIFDVTFDLRPPLRKFVNNTIAFPSAPCF